MLLEVEVGIFWSKFKWLLSNITVFINIYIMCEYTNDTLNNGIVQCLCQILKNAWDIK